MEASPVLDRLAEANSRELRRFRRNGFGHGGQDGVDERDLRDRVGDDACGVPRVRDRHDALARVAPVRRPESDEAAERGRHARRAAGVGGQPHRGDPGGDGRRGAAARASRNAGEVIGVAGRPAERVVRRDAERELVQGVLRGDERPGGQQSLDHRGVAASDPARHRGRAAAGRHAVDVEDVLGHDRQPVQRSGSARLRPGGQAVLPAVDDRIEGSGSCRGVAHGSGDLLQRGAALRHVVEQCCRRVESQRHGGLLWVDAPAA